MLKGRQAVLILTLLMCPAKAYCNPFSEYLTKTPPQILRVLGAEVRGDVKIQRVIFYSRTVQTSDGALPTEVYAIIARPKSVGRYPGILVLHGGAGFASEDQATYWAEHGYVVVVPDLPGIADPQKTPNSTGAWKAAPYGMNHFRASPDVTASDVFDGALAGLQALYLLRSQPDVDDTEIGITGVSWGGYSTIVIAGLAQTDIKAAYAIYGSGHFDLGSSFQTSLNKFSKPQFDAWMTELDAKNYAPNIQADFFEAAATNDNFFWMPAVAATLDDIHSHKNMVLAPNDDHWMNVPGGCDRTKVGVPHSNGWMSMQLVYFDYLLKGKGEPFPEVEDATAGIPKEGVSHIRFHVRGAIGAARASLYYSSPDAPWKKRVWLQIKAESHGGWYEAQVPSNADWFASITDSRPVTVTSAIQSSSVKKQHLAP